MNGLQIGRAPDQLARVAARALEKHRDNLTDTAGIERRLLALEQTLL